MSFLEDVRDWIFESSGLNLGGDQIRTEVEGDKPTDPLITLYTGATEDGIKTQDRHMPAVQYPRAQLIVWSKRIVDAEAMAQKLYDFMYNQEPPYPYETIWPMSLPVKLGPPDGSARYPAGFAIRAQMVA